MNKKVILLILHITKMFFFVACISYSFTGYAVSSGHSSKTIIGNSLPGNWRPFSDTSPWNTPIPVDTKIHPDSHRIIDLAVKEADHIRLAKIYTIPIWVVNTKNIPLVKVRSDKIFDIWDQDRDGWSDIGVPITKSMWPEPTNDGHICIIDPNKMLAWEFSRFKQMEDDNPPHCTTFNIWDLSSNGVGDSSIGERWWARGGRGSGFPLIAGLIRPEELDIGIIRHALVFTFPKNRIGYDKANIFLPPSCRSDGQYIGNQYPIEGMRFQLDPLLTEKDFDNWGLNREGKIVAKALQEYGMFLGDNGGAMALQVQLLAPSKNEQRKKWELLFPGFHKNIKKISTGKFRVVYTGEPVIKK